MKVRICLTAAWALGSIFSIGGLSFAQEAQPAQQPSKFEQVTKGMTKKDAGGEEMWTLYHNDQQLLVELDNGDLQKEYLFLTSIARGIGTGMVLGGMSWSNGFFTFGISFGGGYGYPCCGGYHGGGYHGPVFINNGDINIGNDVNWGNRVNGGDRVSQLPGDRPGRERRVPRLRDAPLRGTPTRPAGRPVHPRPAPEALPGPGRLALPAGRRLEPRLHDGPDALRQPRHRRLVLRD